MNGNIKGDEEGEWTYVGARGNSVIDYVLGNEDTREGVGKVEIGDKIDSDHMPVIVWVKGEMGGKKGRKGGGKRRMVGRWSEEAGEEFREKFAARASGGDGLQEDWEGLKGKILEAIGEMGKNEKIKRKGWWDEECRVGKQLAREELRKWRKEGGDGLAFRERKREYQKLCEERKKKEREKWEKEIEGIKTESQVWKVVSRERKRRSRIDERIRMEEWEQYFRDLLGGVEGRVGKLGKSRREGDGEKDLEIGEIIRVVKGLKDGKAAGGDGIPNEIWKHGGSEVQEELWRICNRVWRGGGWPEDWAEGVVVPIAKKGDSRKVGNYRGVTLTQTAYKIYAAVLAERVREEVERKGLLPASQTGFRKGLGCIDNIYVLNYLINRQVRRKERRLVIMFVDLKAAFDSVDREVLVEAMRKRGVREGLVERCEEVLRETKSKIRVGEEEGECFWTERGVRQGCPLSPLLFTLMLADIDEELERGGWGGVKVGGRKIRTLSYADDIAMLAEEEDGMRGMMGVLERYLEGKKLQLNAEKSKVMRCRVGGGRWKKVSWRWKGKVIEEVGEYNYLGYTITRDGGQKAHVQDRLRKGAAVMGQVWGIGKRKFGKDWGRRVWLFDKLVWSVVSYGVEIWGWKEREGIEKLQERRKCRVCGWENETWEHVWEVCMWMDDSKGWQESMWEMLEDEGGGEEWMRMIDDWRMGMNEKSGSGKPPELGSELEPPYITYSRNIFDRVKLGRHRTSRENTSLEGTNSTELRLPPISGRRWVAGSSLFTRFTKLVTPIFKKMPLEHSPTRQALSGQRTRQQPTEVTFEETVENRKIILAQIKTPVLLMVRVSKLPRKCVYSLFGRKILFYGLRK
ncbi:uncharacterized protein LOC143212411 [Lasioglossum baleicum]|uniref:uncharacterized protein LOC143212411 n=1 Tax=Lasioglossum baleicum TaxID=434251 RepID=UPI003FCC648D